jgi:hypothetical protein
MTNLQLAGRKRTTEPIVDSRRPADTDDCLDAGQFYSGFRYRSVRVAGWGYVAEWKRQQADSVRRRGMGVW